MKVKYKAGFSLIEVTLALGLIVFCVLTLMALLPVGLASDQQSIHQAGAANISASLLADLKNTKSGNVSTLCGLTKPLTTAIAPATYTLYLDENGTRSGNVNADAIEADNPRYRADVTFTPPTLAVSRQAVTVRIRVSWPAMADPIANKAATNQTGFFEVITAIDRN